MINLDNIVTEAQQGGYRVPPEEYAANKKSERDVLYSTADQAALDITDDPRELQKYLDVQAQFDRYTATNALLVYAQNPSATRLGTFEYWRGLKCPVISGPGSSISIFEAGKNYTRADSSVGRSYDVKKVFDISQVDVSKMRPERPKQKPTEKELLSALISRASVAITPVDELPGNQGATYDRAENTVYVQRGLEFAETFRGLSYAVTLAELSAKAEAPNDPYFTAYCASYMLCKKHSVDTKSFTFETPPTALANLDTPQEIRKELSHIRDAANSLSSRMARSLGTAKRETKEHASR